MKTVITACIVLGSFLAFTQCDQPSQEQEQKASSLLTATDSLDEQTLAMLDLLHLDDQSVLPSEGPDTARPELIIHPSKTGRWISIDSATLKMDTWNSYNRRSNGSAIISPYAFAFGTENIRKLIKEIDKLNSRINTPKDSIMGVRVYLTMTKNIAEAHMDLLFMPVQGNGRDLYQLDSLKFFDPIGILNTSSPCPDVCD